MDVDEQQLDIRLANESDVLKVDAALMRACSSVARGLPAEAAEWDLSNLLIDGQPVQRNTVDRWLNHCYYAVHGKTFDGRSLQWWKPPAAELFQLLAFADSIGSTRGPITACTAEDDLVRLQIVVTGLPLPQQRQQQQQQEQQQRQQQQQKSIQILLDRPCYKFVNSGNAELQYALETSEHHRDLLCDDAKEAVTAQVAAQTEQLLYIAHKLRLKELLHLLKDFIAAASCPDPSAASWWHDDEDSGADLLLPSHVLQEAVYSPRVLQAAGYPEAAAKAAWIRSQLQQPLLGGQEALLSLDHMTFIDGLQAANFSASLNRSYKGKRKHSDVEVALELSERCVKLHALDDHWVQEIPLALCAPDIY